LHPVSSDASLSRDSSSYGPGSDVSLPGSFEVSDKAALSWGAPPEGTSPGNSPLAAASNALPRAMGI
jgi:hypothetical protein